MCALRFGSYSSRSTLASMPSLLRLKSMIRYCCLWPPPLCRTVMWPLLLRPEPRFWLVVSASTGRPLCRFGWTTLISARRPGDVGFTFWRGILFIHCEVDFLARLQADVGL